MKRPDRFSGGSSHTLVDLATTRLGKSSVLTAEERTALDNVGWTSCALAAGAEFVREGECGDTVHLLVDGCGYRYKISTDGRRSIVTLLLPGDVCNLDVLLLERPNHSVRVVTPATVLQVPRDRVLALMSQHPGIARVFAALAMAENAILGEWALCLGRRQAIERLAHLLCELSVRLGQREEDARFRFDLPLTQEELADILGLTSVHVSRMLHQLRATGLIVVARRSIDIPDVPRLRRLGGFDPGYLHTDGRDAGTMRLRARGVVRRLDNEADARAALRTG